MPSLATIPTMNDPGPSLVIITGPTAIGKTCISIHLAKTFSTEIISCDSRQFYRELNIGVARPGMEELASVPHHMIGFLSIRDSYNVYQFETDALGLCKELFACHAIVIMTGGSGLYIRSIIQGIDDLPDPDPALREQLKKELEEDGICSLQQKLQQLDPEYYNEVDLSNPKRLLRAIEVTITTGIPYSSLRIKQPQKRPFRIIQIGLNTDREDLYDRINERVDEMIEKGLIEEARDLYHCRNLNALNTVGYKELFAYFDGTYSLEQTVEKIKTNTRRYAKRQLTWFRKDPGINWFEPDQLADIQEHVERQVESHPQTM